MAQAENVQYFQRRFDQERQLAERAERIEVRQVHSRLAAEYAKRVAGDPIIIQTALDD